MFDQEGGLLWEFVIDSALHNLHERLRERPDGSYLIAGSASRPGRPFRIQLLVIDPDGA